MGGPGAFVTGRWRGLRISEAAEGFAGDADVGGELGEGNAPDEVGSAPLEVEVAVAGRKEVDEVGVFQQFLVELGHEAVADVLDLFGAGVEAEEVVGVKFEDGGGFVGLYPELGGGLASEAFYIGRELAFGGKVEVDVFAGVVVESTQQAALDEVEPLAYLAFPQEVVFSFVLLYAGDVQQEAFGFF